jgi:hypothetical protein
MSLLYMQHMLRFFLFRCLIYIILSNFFFCLRNKYALCVLLLVLAVVCLAQPQFVLRDTNQ